MFHFVIPDVVKKFADDYGWLAVVVSVIVALISAVATIAVACIKMKKKAIVNNNTNSPNFTIDGIKLKENLKYLEEENSENETTEV